MANEQEARAAGQRDALPFVCRHADPRCDDDPCPWGIARSLCNAPAGHPARALTASTARQTELDMTEGRFSEWTTTDLAAQCRMQARDGLDPEYEQLMYAVASRLEPARPTERGAVEKIARVIDPLAWRDRDSYVGIMKAEGNCAPETIADVAHQHVRHSLRTAHDVLEALALPAADQAAEVDGPLLDYPNVAHNGSGWPVDAEGVVIAARRLDTQPATGRTKGGEDGR